MSATFGAKLASIAQIYDPADLLEVQDKLCTVAGALNIPLKSLVNNVMQGSEAPFERRQKLATYYGLVDDERKAFLTLPEQVHPLHRQKIRRRVAAPEMPEKAPETAAEILLSVRKRRGISREEMAALCQIDESRYERFETGQMIPYEGELLKILTRCDEAISPDSLHKAAHPLDIKTEKPPIRATKLGAALTSHNSGKFTGIGNAPKLAPYRDLIFDHLNADDTLPIRVSGKTKKTRSASAAKEEPLLPLQDWLNALLEESDETRVTIAEQMGKTVGFVVTLGMKSNPGDQETVTEFLTLCESSTARANKLRLQTEQQLARLPRREAIKDKAAPGNGTAEATPTEKKSSLFPLSGDASEQTDANWQNRVGTPSAGSAKKSVRKGRM